MKIRHYFLRATHGIRTTIREFNNNSFQHPRINTSLIHTKKSSFLHISTEKLSYMPDVPEKEYFDHLRTVETRLFGSTSNRIRTSFKKNLTAALALPYSIEKLDSYAKDQEALLARCKDHIIEHANRRVDLFFYTMLAYYKTNCPPTLGTVHRQHGKGRMSSEGNILTEACHSSLLPSLIDKTIRENTATGKKYGCILSHTHFMKSLNSTVELPFAVNRFDDVLEHHLGCRKTALEILCHVALGYYSPMDGLTIFLKVMDQILTEETSDKARESRYHFFKKHPQFSNGGIPSEIIALTAQGTLETTFDHHTQTASEAYIRSLLRMPDNSNEYCPIQRMAELQQELLTQIP